MGMDWRQQGSLSSPPPQPEMYGDAKASQDPYTVQIRTRLDKSNQYLNVLIERLSNVGDRMLGGAIPVHRDLNRDPSIRDYPPKKAEELSPSGAIEAILYQIKMIENATERLEVNVSRLEVL